MAHTTGDQDRIFADCSFTDLGLSSLLADQLRERMGFHVPTLIQKETIPAILSGRHVLVNAGTGTGKTLVYLAPIIQKLQAHMPRIKRADGAFALVIVPTRELCLQVYEVLQRLLHRFHWIVPGYLMGGENRSKEKARLRKGINILIATPGRLLDHLKHTLSFNYNKLQWLIFDEADRLLDLGFGKAIEEILFLLKATSNGHGGKELATDGTSENHKQHKILLSATLTEQVNYLAKISLENPLIIGLNTCSASSSLLENEQNDDGLHFSVRHPQTEYKFPPKLVQRYIKVPCRLRLVVLLAFLQSQVKSMSSSKVVVFFSTCDAVDFHYALLNEFHWSSTLSEDVDEEEDSFLQCKTFRLHGNMVQDERKDSFHGFSEEKNALLLCTDVAARGLDFPRVRCIVQYDSPGDASEYVHRVGRTARLDQKGEALLFLQPVELDYLKELQRHAVPLSELPVENVLNVLQSPGMKQRQRKQRTIDMHPGALLMQRNLDLFINADDSMKQLAKDAFCSFVRSYAAHQGDLKRIFQVKKLHLGHVAKTFGLKDQPSLVGASFNKLKKKRERAEKLKHRMKKKRRVS